MSANSSIVRRVHHEAGAASQEMVAALSPDILEHPAFRERRIRHFQVVLEIQQAKEARRAAAKETPCSH